ncbi:hypothetical protein [Brevundimonas sp. Root1423]|uniref:hypothetical protein n=1 Tax=Brevundimonas sp. Root1423 TaxID=1736462 RepID=UPI000A56E4A6|nr:hypothetical protein [Brevundimonas sp. Root1423]
MTRLHDNTHDLGLLDEEAWDAPRRLTDDDLFAHGDDGWRRAGFDFNDPEDFL